MTPLKHLTRRRINRCETSGGNRLSLRLRATSVEAWRARAIREADHANGLYLAAANVAYLGALHAGVAPVAEDVVRIARAPVWLRWWVEEASTSGFSSVELAYHRAASKFLYDHVWGPDKWIEPPPVVPLPQCYEDELARLGAEITTEVELAVSEYAEELAKWREGHARMWGGRRDAS